jgi:hypothetical protein
MHAHCDGSRKRKGVHGTPYCIDHPRTVRSGRHAHARVGMLHQRDKTCVREKRKHGTHET